MLFKPFLSEKNNKMIFVHFFIFLPHSGVMGISSDSLCAVRGLILRDGMDGNK
jgi:hypothetical protein